VAAPLIQAVVNHFVDTIPVHAAIGFCRVGVCEEIHHFTADFFKVIFKGIRHLTK